MKVSIAMATYNGAKYLLEQLQSFENQTRRPDELIVTDDCSTDDTESVVLEFAKTASFKVVFTRNSEQLGYCGNFNSALMSTTGDIVFLSDQDDQWFPEKIQEMLCLAQQNPDALVLMNDAVYTDGDLNPFELRKIEQIQLAGMSMSSFVMGCCCCIRREFLGFWLPIPNTFNSHDVWLVRLAEGLDAKFILDKPLQYYRRHDTNASDFVANSTEKITKVKMMRYYFENIFYSRDKCKALESYRQNQIFIDGLTDINPPPKYKAKLQKYRRALKIAHDFDRKRLNVRSKDFLPRVISVLYFFVVGEYRCARGWKSAVRDVLG